jgi:hypothetical protein
MIDFTDVEIVLPHAKAIAFDGCHKIYVLMDNEQVTKMTGYGYGDDGYDDVLALAAIHGQKTTPRYVC